MTTMPRAAGHVSLVGTVLALCGCLGFPAVIALLSVLGAHWLLAPRFLLPVLMIAIALGLWSLIGAFRRSREPLPLVLGLVGGAAALATEVVRALTHEHAYFLGYPGLGLFVAAFISTLLLQRRRLGREDAGR